MENKPCAPSPQKYRSHVQGVPRPKAAGRAKRKDDVADGSAEVDAAAKPQTADAEKKTKQNNKITTKK